MKKTNSNLLKSAAYVSFLSAMVAAVPVHAANEGWYISNSIGSIDVDDVSLNSNGAVNGIQSPRNLTIGSDSDVAFGFAGGYRFKGTQFGAVRVEGELQYGRNDVDQINFNNNVFTADQGFVEGDIESTSLFVNVAQEFEGLAGSVRPYVGIGIGLTEFYGDFRYNPNLTANIDDDDIAFSYQLFAGIDVDLTERFTGFIDYHFVKTEDFELDRFGGGAGGPAQTSQEGDVELGIFSIGLRYSFK